MRKRFVLGLIVFFFCTLNPRSGMAQLAGDWIGQIDFGQSWQRVNLHFHVTGENITGTIDLPRQNRFTLPLTRVTSDSTGVRIEWQGNQGLAVYKGQLEGNEIRGEFQQGEIKQPFRLVRTTMFDPRNSGRYAGSYQIGTNRFIDIGPFSENEDRPIFFDSATRRSGVLYALSETDFFSGPSYGNLFEIDIRIAFLRDKKGDVTGLKWREGKTPEITAKRIAPYTHEEVSFQNGDVNLRGTLTLPAGKGQHPVVVVVPGSGSFRRPGGFWVHFFVRHGIGVFVFDKRGSGASSGDWRTSTYEDLATDVLSGIRTLKEHDNINPTQIGLWGNSEGGWVAPLAASQSADVAFLIIRSGSSLAVWKTVLHEAEGKFGDGLGLSQEEIKQAIAFKQLTEGIAISGKPWDEAWAEIEAHYRRASGEKWLRFVMGPPKEHWYWQWWRLRGPYDPAPTLAKIRTPVLVLLGELDWAIPSKQSAIGFEQGFKKAGNRDYEVRILPEGNHGLLEASTGYGSEFSRLKRYVPGYMDGMAAWLLKRVKTNARQPPRKARIDP